MSACALQTLTCLNEQVLWSRYVLGKPDIQCSACHASNQAAKPHACPHSCCDCDCNVQCSHICPGCTSLVLSFTTLRPRQCL